MMSVQPPHRILWVFSAQRGQALDPLNDTQLE